MSTTRYDCIYLSSQGMMGILLEIWDYVPVEQELVATADTLVSLT